MALFLGYMQGIIFQEETLRFLMLNNRHVESKNSKVPPMNLPRSYRNAERNFMDEIITPRFSYEEKLYGLEE